MADFKVIETQEQFDAAISERLKRDRETQAKKYEGWTSPEDMQKVIGGYESRIKALEDAAAATQQTLAEKDAAIAESTKYKTDLEKTRIALSVGLDLKYAERLKGENADEWKADAEELAKDFAAAHVTAPLGPAEPTVDNTNKSDNAWKAFAASFGNNTSN